MRAVRDMVMRALAAMLLALAVASPAVAEISCAADTQCQILAEIGAHEGDDHAEDGDAPVAPDQGADHCAFNHGHCGGLAPIMRARIDAQAMPADHDRPRADPFASRQVSGLERPPRR